MSSPGVAISIIPRGIEPTAHGGNWFIQTLAKYRPYQGWSTFIILVLMLMILADSVRDAGWVRSLDLPGVIFWGALAGLGLSKVRLHAALLQPLGLVLGFLVVVWRASPLDQAGRDVVSIGSVV